MKVSHLPKATGIYRIMNSKNGKMYVGSATTIKRRVQAHVAFLTLGTHYNKKLQRAWDKYGPESFSADVLELVDDLDVLIEREQYWIDLTQCVKNGYNLKAVAGPYIDNSKKFSGWISPIGESVTITNMAKFCRDNDLDNASMWKVMQGIYPQHKGWRYPAGNYVAKKPKASQYRGTVYRVGAWFANVKEPAPSKKRHVIRCETELEAAKLRDSIDYYFYRDVSRLNFPNETPAPWEPPVKRVASSRYYGVSWNAEKRKWSAYIYLKTEGAKRSKTVLVGHYSTEQEAAKAAENARNGDMPEKTGPAKVYYGFVSPAGVPTPIHNLTEFCRSNDLSNGNMRALRTGERKTHKGWTYNPSLER